MTKLDGLTARELRRLSRKDLLTLLLEQAQHTAALERTLQETRQQQAQELAAQQEQAAAKIEFLQLQLKYEATLHIAADLLTRIAAPSDCAPTNAPAAPATDRPQGERQP